MSQSRVHFSGPRAAIEAAYQTLEAAFDDDGFPLAIVELDEDNAIFEASVYVDGDGLEVERRVRELVGAAAGDIQRETLPDIDWVTHTLQGLAPVRAGRFLVHGSHDRDRRQANDLAIEIEAGLAFGTGHHGTTAGCLAMIESVARRERPRSALDLGTGSAVLAIALAKLCHISVLATDIDPVATRVARANTVLNGVGALVECVTAVGFAHPALTAWRPFDLIVANILARPLMRLAPAMAAHVTPGGSIILSGILDKQRDAVVSAYVNQRFRHVQTTHREGWVTIHLKR